MLYLLIIFIRLQYIRLFRVVNGQSSKNIDPHKNKADDVRKARENSRIVSLKIKRRTMPNIKKQKK